MQRIQAVIWALAAVGSGFSPIVKPGIAQDANVLRVETRLVLVDVVVRNDDGPVGGLDADDFRIFDEGDAQEIAVFEATSGTVDAATALALPPGVGTNRRDWRGAIPTSSTVILIDRVNTPTDGQNYAHTELREFVANSDSLEGIAIYELLSDQLRVVHDFTDDPSALAEAIGRLEPEHSLALDSSSVAGGFEADAGTIGLDQELANLVGGGGGPGIGTDTGFERRSGDYFLGERIVRTAAALETITHHLAGLPGRKNIVWLSGRFPFTYRPWSNNVLVNQVQRPVIQQIEDTGILINEANIAIYPVDVRGQSGQGADVSTVTENIARATGGRTFRTNAVATAIRTALSDSQMLYTLGFYPSEVDDDPGSRDLRVEIEGRDLDLLYRPTYHGFGEENIRLAADPLELFSSPIEATGIGLTGVSAPVSDGAEGVELITLVDVTDLGLTETAGVRTGALDFHMVFRALDDGTVYTIPKATYNVNMNAQQFETALRTGFIIQRVLNTEGRTGIVRIVVQDLATGNTGSLSVGVGTN